MAVHKVKGRLLPAQDISRSWSERLVDVRVFNDRGRQEHVMAVG